MEISDLINNDAEVVKVAAVFMTRIGELKGFLDETENNLTNERHENRFLKNRYDSDQELIKKLRSDLNSKPTQSIQPIRTDASTAMLNVARGKLAELGVVLTEDVATLQSTYKSYIDYNNNPENFLTNDYKIAAIKSVREVTGMGLREAKDYVEAFIPHKAKIESLWANISKRLRINPNSPYCHNQELIDLVRQYSIADLGNIALYVTAEFSRSFTQGFNGEPFRPGIDDTRSYDVGVEASKWERCTVFGPDAAPCDSDGYVILAIQGSEDEILTKLRDYKEDVQGVPHPKYIN